MTRKPSGSIEPRTRLTKSPATKMHGVKADATKAHKARSPATKMRGAKAGATKAHGTRSSATKVHGARSREAMETGTKASAAKARGVKAPGTILLATVGARIRGLRKDRGWTRRELAARTGLSERFLAQVETGRGNPSVLSLAQIAGALACSPAALLAAVTVPPLAALLGLRGAGKSTVGSALASRLGVPFIELDARIEEAAGLSLAEIFELHGEGAYRRWEREALEDLVARGERVVVATGGSIVTHAENFELLRRHAITIWLRASPEEHWNRVLAQGDHRPMANDPLAMAQMRELLARREEIYRTADHTVVTSGASVAEVLEVLTRIMAGWADLREFSTPHA